jgi:hypothetical protein
VIECIKVYNAYSGITTNQAESLNFVIKQLQEWKEAPPDCILLSVYYLQSYYVLRGQRGLGNYHVHIQFGKIFCTQPLPSTVCAPQQIVKCIKGKHQIDTKDKSRILFNSAQTSASLSQKERAQRIIEENRISFDKAHNR